MSIQRHDSTTKSVPWATVDELRKVFYTLYSKDIGQRREALKVIEIWKIRAKKLPVSLDCTVELFEAKLLDYESDDSPLNIYRQSAYAMAITRFVNLITEENQTDMHRLSVHNLARKLNIPEWIINLRMDSTHAGLPSLPLLRTATDMILEYLKENFWIQICAKDEDDDGDIDATSLILDYLKNFVYVQPSEKAWKVLAKVRTMLKKSFLKDSLFSKVKYFMQEPPERYSKLFKEFSKSADEDSFNFKVFEKWTSFFELLHMSGALEEFIDYVAEDEDKLTVWRRLWLFSLLKFYFKKLNVENDDLDRMVQLYFNCYKVSEISKLHSYLKINPKWDDYYEKLNRFTDCSYEAMLADDENSILENSVMMSIEEGQETEEYRLQMNKNDEEIEIRLKELEEIEEDLSETMINRAVEQKIADEGRQFGVFTTVPKEHSIWHIPYGASTKNPFESAVLLDFNYELDIGKSDSWDALDEMEEESATNGQLV